MAFKPGDILIDLTDYDLQIVNGDFKIGDATAQHQECLLLAGKGDYKCEPLIGVDVFKHLNDHSNTLNRDVRIEFVKDGMTVNSVNTLNNKLEIDASYNSK
jgi:hypothetical protein